MIIDSHCHAWRVWPYKPPVPDPENRGRVEQLLYEMDVNGVDQALVVCAQIDHNPGNNAYVAEAVAQYPDRLHQVADLDSAWSATYHTPGAADRLAALADLWPIKGFTHYLRRDDNGDWLASADGLALFQTAADCSLLASLSCYPHQQAAIRRVAATFPSVPILCHHLGHPRLDDAEGLSAILASAECPNVCFKVSGFYYAAKPPWAYPWTAAWDVLRALYEHFGPHRLLWGSDYPVVRFHATYRQALEAVRTHYAAVSEEDLALILGGALRQLLT